MTEEKLFIKNRKKQKIAVIVEKAQKQKGLVFVMHELGGFKEQNHLETFAKAFRNKNFTVVRFDTTNTLGESDGAIEKARTTGYYKDLQDVIKWAGVQDWYQEPFALAGHSLGGICTALYAQKHPKKVSLLTSISTVVSGKLIIKAYKGRKLDDILETEQPGWFRYVNGKYKPGHIKRLIYGFIRDAIKYDLLKAVSKLTMPVLLFVGENDITAPAEHVQILYQSLPEPKELCIIKDATHAFKDKKHLSQIEKILSTWIEKYG